MRIDPWKLAGLVLLVFLVNELARPEVAHAPGMVLDAEAPAVQEPAPTDVRQARTKSDAHAEETEAASEQELPAEVGPAAGED